MLSAVSCRPVVTDPAALLQRHFGVTGKRLRELDSFNDRNWHVQACGTRTSSNSGGGGQAATEYVLKVHNYLESEDLDAIEVQNAVLQHLCARSLPVPAPIATVGGRCSALAALPLHGGASTAPHAVRLLTYLPGTPLSAASCRSVRLFRHIGALLGRVDKALSSFSTPALERRDTPGLWDLRSAARIIVEMLPRHTNSVQRQQLEWVVQRHAEVVAPVADDLPRGWCHADGNEDNILVAGEDVVGLIDWGDCCHTYRVAEAAIAMCYAMLLTTGGNPLEAAAAVLEGYQSEVQLTQPELRVLPALIACRIAQSLVIGCAAVAQDPDNAAYLTHSHAASWATLDTFMAQGLDAVGMALGAA